MRLRNIPGAKDAILDCEWVIDEPERFKGKWNEVFGVKRPLFLEVGMGKGRFLMDMARLHPERNFVGIEMYDSVLLRALQKREELEAAGEEFSNLVFIRVDARLLPEIFEKDEVDGTGGSRADLFEFFGSVAEGASCKEKTYVQGISGKI